jgi:hypothetical protein
MYIVLTDVLSEHNLVKAENTPAFNINRITLILLEFLNDTANDFDVQHKEEFVRAADIAGVNLTPRDGIKVDQNDIDGWRFSYQDDDEEDSDGETLFNEKAWRSKWDWKTMVTISRCSAFLSLSANLLSQ